MSSVEITEFTGLRPRRNYRHMAILLILAISVVSITPLVTMAVVNYRQYQRAMQEESTRRIRRLTSSGARTLEFFLSERQSALQFVVSEIRPETLLRDGEIERLLTSLKLAFGGFVDLEVIDSSGSQAAYSGPFDLPQQSYRGEDWYREVLARGTYTSKVFLGHRNLPHFVIAIHHVPTEGNSFVLRATVDTETLDREVAGVGASARGNAFVIDHEGTLQTPSASYGAALNRVPWEVPPFTSSTRTIERTAVDGRRTMIGYAYVRNSPFILVHESGAEDIDRLRKPFRRELVLFVLGSTAAILAAVIWGVLVMLRRARESDRRHAALLHQFEYTNKMVAIGRLAAGVAHEVNNPLAIIGEKAGLLEDIVEESGAVPDPEFVLKQTASILRSVDRCAAITHRLLGFAKHVDVCRESIDVPLLLANVYGFLEREATYRNVGVTFVHEDGLPAIVSDRGQLEQVFLNILNNALAAVDTGGRIDVRTRSTEEGGVLVSVEDDGVGISAEDMERIFEPFFSRKGAAGTGLGLSITYGIMEKLGGRIHVESEPGRGTKFSVTLPPDGGDTDRKEEKDESPDRR